MHLALIITHSGVLVAPAILPGVVPHTDTFPLHSRNDGTYTFTSRPRPAAC